MIEYKQITLADAKKYGKIIGEAVLDIDKIIFLGLHGGLGAGEKIARDADFLCYVYVGDNISINSKEMLSCNHKIDKYIKEKTHIKQRKPFQIRDNIEMIAHSLTVDDYKMTIHVVNQAFISHAVSEYDKLNNYLRTNIFDWKVRPQSIYRLWINEIIPLYDPFHVREKFHKKTKNYPTKIYYDLRKQFKELLKISIKSLKDPRVINNPFYFKLKLIEALNILILAIYNKNKAYFGLLSKVIQDLNRFYKDRNIANELNKLFCKYPNTAEMLSMIENIYTLTMDEE